ncbi:hypothetical protein AJ80_01468 [Polytolypa hystricis UAMH7299]|uniref:Nephrocystin 3-like N-terminal domain-containing protein n=1 Tax=Polytolypa hystricis (strain UAMH7299) TaxID=1447883 RepID=A0A2B7YYY0_POLH7|nr:hypothetical protein AJ80_01468 [Polytolypa hystricis UAMH7299]
MADPFSTGSAVIGVISLTIQVTQALVQFGLDWKDAPHDIRAFMTELQTFKTILSETNTNLLNSDFVEVFHNRPSLLISELGSNASPTTETRQMLSICETALEDLLQELREKAKGHRLGWDRIKTVFRARNIRESVETLYRRCQVLNNMVLIDATTLGATTYKEVKEQERQAILDWLSSDDYASQQADIIHRRQEGTGLWLLDSAQFRTWVDQRNQTLFCPGIPGAGKTMNTAIVIDKLYTEFQSGSNVGIAYVYCNFRRQNEQNPIDLLASLLKQLLCGQLSISRSARQLYEGHRQRATRPSLHEISQVIESVVLDYSKVFILVDALDECQVSNGGRQIFLTSLFNLQAKTAVNLYITSRFIPEITKQFAGSVALEIRASNHDVERYLSGQMFRLRSFVGRNIRLQEEIKRGIADAVDGMFLLAQLYFDSLTSKTTPNAIRRELNGFRKRSETSGDKNKSKALDIAYTQVMERIEGQEEDLRDLAKNALSWITCTRKPLTTFELQHAISVEPGQSELDEDRLVIVDDESNIIRLIHYTVQEYFEQTEEKWFPEAQTDIAKTCLTYLSFDSFGNDAGVPWTEFKPLLQLHPLYKYAANNWTRHICVGTTEVEQLILSLSQHRGKLATLSLALGEGYCLPLKQPTTIVHIIARLRATEVMKLLVKSGYALDAKDSDGFTPLSWATLCGHNAVVELLLGQEGLNINTKDKYAGRTPLFLATEFRHGTIVKLLLEQKDVEAAGTGLKSVIKPLMMRPSVDVNSRDLKGLTPLCYAIFSGREEAVQLLLSDDRVKLDLKSENGWTSLAWAVRIGQEATIKQLLEKENTCQTPTSLIDQTLMWAAIGDETDPRFIRSRSLQPMTKRLLLDNRIDPNSPRADSHTPLSWAIVREDEIVVELLLSRDDVNVNFPDGQGRTPLSWAAMNGKGCNIEIFGRLTTIKNLHDPLPEILWVVYRL